MNKVYRHNSIPPQDQKLATIQLWNYKNEIEERVRAVEGTVYSKDGMTIERIEDFMGKFITTSNVQFAKLGIGKVPVAEIDVLGSILASGDIYTKALTDFSGSSYVSGWADTPTVVLYYKKIGKTVIVNYNIDGTGNSSATTFGLPSASSISVVAPAAYTVNDGAYDSSPGYCSISGITASLYRYAGTAWTASGNKNIAGQIIYEE